MAFISFLGRLLFVSVFVLSAYQEFNEFGVDGGPAAKSLKPKFDVFSKHVTTQTGIQLPHVDMKHLILGAIALKSLGSLLFVFGSSFGALILLLNQAITTPILYDFYNYEADKKEFNQLFVKFTQGLALLGALLFFVGMKNSLPTRSPKKKVTKAKAN
ncbi:HR-like lesion-inducing protein-like protein [Perilla frutescens var. frutescens]|nr:HR-like lesion-inducing protein-like protein [Perilla frutescens var. frutescens]